MLKYKLIQNENDLPLLLDNRFSYSDMNIIHILKFIYTQYRQKITDLKQSYTYKLNALNNLNIKLIAKKNTYKTLLSEIKKIYDPTMIQELYIIFGGNKSNFNTYKKAHNYLNRSIQNINNDIRLINQLKKSFKTYLEQYQNINLFYDNKAKITAYDIKKAKKGELTQHTKECLYYYLIQFKKTNNRNFDINTTLNPFMDINQLKNIVQKSINKSFELHLKTVLKDNTTTLHNNLLNKWL